MVMGTISMYLSLLGLIALFLPIECSEWGNLTRRNILQKSHVTQEWDHKEILKLKPSETAAKSLGDHVSAAAEVKMWEPLWPEAHRPGEHAVFALALNYDIRHFYWFVGSLRKVGFKGDIVLAVNQNINKALETFLKDNRVIAYPLFVKCKSKLQCVIEQWFTPIDGTLPMAIIRHYLYLSWMQHYSAESLISVLDFRDTVFQSDPFKYLENELEQGSTTELWLSGEHMPYKRIRNCVFNSGWIRDCYGREEAQQYGASPVICSGSIFGTKRGIQVFETKLLEEVSKKRCHEHFVESDQGYTNILYHSGALAAAGIKAQFDNRGVGPVNTIGAFGGKRHGYYVGSDILKSMRDSEGYVLNCPIEVRPEFQECSPDAKPGSPCLADHDAVLNFAECKDTTRSPVVHQWDRHAGDLGKFIEKHIACRTNCMNGGLPETASA